MATLIRGGLVVADADSPPTPADILLEGDRIARVGPDLPAGPDTTVLDARDRVQAVVAAYESGLVEPGATDR